MESPCDRKRVLLVDDEEATLFGLYRQLRNRGLRVDAAASLSEAGHLVARWRYDVVIADLRLSGSAGREGLQILAWARREQPGARLILMSAYGTPDIIREAGRWGDVLFLEKPIGQEELSHAMAGLAPEPSDSRDALQSL